jgi:amino acid permease
MPRYVKSESSSKVEASTFLLPSASPTSREDGASILQTSLNLANALEGMGLLALPFTVVLAGGVAFPIVVFCALLSGYSACAIVASLYSRASAGHGASLGEWERQRGSYQDIGKAAFGESGGRLVLGVQLVTLLAVAGLFLVLVGNALEGAVPGGFLGRRGWTVLTWVVVGPTAWIPSLRQISWLSGAGVALLGGLVSAVVYAAAVVVLPDGGVQQQAAGGSAAGGAGAPPLTLWQTRQAELPDLSFRSVPCVFGMVLFSFSCHTMLPAMEAAMRPSERRYFPAVRANIRVQKLTSESFIHG